MLHLGTAVSSTDHRCPRTNAYDHRGQRAGPAHRSPCGRPGWGWLARPCEPREPSIWSLGPKNYFAGCTLMGQSGAFT